MSVQPAATSGQPVTPAAPPSNVTAETTLLTGIAAVLAADLTVRTATGYLLPLLAPLKLGGPAISSALILTRVASVGPGRTGGRTITGPALARTLAGEPGRRAAFLLAAARRIQSRLSAGQPLGQAIAPEKRYLAQHRAAQAGRLTAAAQVDRAARAYGPVLTWMLGDRRTHTADCVHAAGKRFLADTPPALGYPGTVHAQCGCWAGPGSFGRGWVDLPSYRAARGRGLA